MKARRQAEDRDSIPLEFSMNGTFSIEERAVLCNDGVSLEERLYRHVNYYLSELENKDCELIALMKESIGPYRRIPIIHEGMTIANVRSPIDSILLFSPFWIRDPLHWDRNSNVSLVEYLFVEYPVPWGMYRDWYFPLDKNNMKWITCFILLAQGGSLKRASKWFGWKESPRFQHYYIQLIRHHLHAHSRASISDLAMGAEINRLGGSDRHMMMFSKNPFFRIDPTNKGVRSREFMRFWYQTIHWFINKGEYFDDNQYEHILHRAESGSRRPISWLLSRLYEQELPLYVVSVQQRLAQSDSLYEYIGDGRLETAGAPDMLAIQPGNSSPSSGASRHTAQ